MTIPKFRAWDEDSQKMNGNVEIYIAKDKTIEVRPKDDKTSVMQSTGLFDKNDKEIFEGDIVHAYSEGARLIGVIEYFDNAYCIKDKNGIYNSLWTNAEQYEIIGNIYENPELVEEE